MSQQKPRQRGGRVLDKATPEQVMGLARNLPLTHSVLEKALADATPGQLGFLANLFEKENASRAESKRRRLLKQAGFPQSKTLEGYDRGMASFPADRGREQLESLEFVDRAEDLVFYGDVGCGKTHLAIAIGMLACQRMIPVRFFTASSLVMRLRKAKDDNRLDAELKSIGRAGLVIIDELGYLPIDIDGARLLFQVIADSYETRSVIFTSNLESGRWGDVFGDGDMAAAVIDRIVHHGSILRFHGESYREQTLPHEINQTNNKTRNQPPSVFKLNADGVRIKCRTRPPQFDEIQPSAVSACRAGRTRSRRTRTTGRVPARG